MSPATFARKRDELIAAKLVGHKGPKKGGIYYLKEKGGKAG